MRAAPHKRVRLMRRTRVRALQVRHNRTRIIFDNRALATPEPRRGLLLLPSLQYAQDGHYNRTMAAALRKAMLSRPSATPLLVLHVCSGVGTQSIVAAQARPQVKDFVVACEKSASEVAIAESAARQNSVSERISFLQKDARNIKANAAPGTRDATPRNAARVPVDYIPPDASRRRRTRS